jgi:hypothetical protein
MIIAGTRPVGYAELRDRARRAAAATVAEAGEDAPDAGDSRANEPVKSAVEIAPRPPSD